MALRASIDLGTNTCLLLVAEVSAPTVSGIRIQEDLSTIVRLGQGVDGARKLHPDAIARTLECLKAYSAQVKAHGINPGDVVAVATSQARDAKDGAEFFARVKSETGFEFKTLTGQQEAEATFKGALLPEMDPRTSRVIDIGGGSTEWTRDPSLLDLPLDSRAISLDLGSVRFTERYFGKDPHGAAQDEDFWSCQDAIDLELQKVSPSRVGEHLVACAGTATTLAALHLALPRFQREAIDGCLLTRGDLHRMVEELKWRNLAEKRAMPGMEEKRADVILAGAMILWRSMEVLGYKELTVSTRGLRYGVLLMPST